MKYFGFFLSVVILTGCLSDSKNEYSIASGNKASYSYRFSEKLADKDNRFINIETSGSSDNYKLIVEKKVDFSILRPDTLASIAVSSNHLKIVTSLFPEYIVMFSLSESPETLSLDEIENIYAGEEPSSRFTSTRILTDRLFLQKKTNLIEKNTADSLKGLIDNIKAAETPEDSIHNTEYKKTVAVFVLSKNSPLMSDIQDGFLDGYGTDGKIVNSDHSALLKKLFINKNGLAVNFLNNNNPILKKKIEDLRKLYKFYQASELKNGVALYKQNALLVTHDSIKNNLVKSLLSHTKSILGNSTETCSSIHCYAGVPLHIETAKFDMYKATSSHGFAQYFYFIIYLLFFIVSIIVLMWLAIYKKSSILNKITTSKNLISWIVNHRIYSYLFLMIIIFYVASISIKNIEIIEEDALNIQGYFLNLSIPDIFSDTGFV